MQSVCRVAPPDDPTTIPVSSPASTMRDLQRLWRRELANWEKGDSARKTACSIAEERRTTLRCGWRAYVRLGRSDPEEILRFIALADLLGESSGTNWHCSEFCDCWLSSLECGSSGRTRTCNPSVNSCKTSYYRHLPYLASCCLSLSVYAGMGGLLSYMGLPKVISVC